MSGRIRITFDVDEDVKAELMRLCPHGTLKLIMNKITRDLVEALKEDPEAVISGIIHDHIKLNDFSSVKKDG